jgi:hypothetical protein
MLFLLGEVAEQVMNRRISDRYEWKKVIGSFAWLAPYSIRPSPQNNVQSPSESAFLSLFSQGEPYFYEYHRQNFRFSQAARQD